MDIHTQSTKQNQYRIKRPPLIEPGKFYLVCSSKNRNRCPGTKVILFDQTQMTCTKNRLHSGHSLPTIQRIPDEVKGSIERQARLNITATQINHNLCAEFPRHYTGTIRQIKHVQNSSLGLPSGEGIAKVCEVGIGFLQELSLISEGKSNFMMMCWNPKSLV